MTIQSITGICPHPQAPAEYRTCYCYDSVEHRLIAEPIVHDATNAITVALTHAGICKAGEPPESVLLQFTNDVADVANFKSGAVVLELKFNKQGDCFTFYDVRLTLPIRAAINAAMAGIVSNVFPAAPLCSHLLDYFDQAPSTLYVGVTVN